MNERLVAAAGDAVGKRPNQDEGEGRGGQARAEESTVRVIDEIFTRNAGP